MDQRIPSLSSRDRYITFTGEAVTNEQPSAPHSDEPQVRRWRGLLVGGVALLVLAISVFWILRGPAGDESQPRIRLICGQCGARQEMSAAIYSKRMNQELPDGDLLTRGAVLTCAACGKRALRREQPSPSVQSP